MKRRAKKERVKHIPHCVRKYCGGTFRCDTCKRMVGYCMGAADDKPNTCTDCWYKKWMKGRR